ncbi:MAG TPA: DUF1800 domain-containing protein [Usitatibacter sp.]|nr:DUF1800 domain-containing protein [Usitatibacter sp.]
MRALAAIAFAAAALSAHAQELGYDNARHLLNRTGFGASDAEVRAFSTLDRREAVERLLSGARRQATLAPPAFVSEPYAPYGRLRSLSQEERMAAQRKAFQQGVELRAWWLREMTVTPSPLTERMTLFWHNHFATSQQKVKSGVLMYRQNVLLRREALGNFATLLHAVSKDPAMLAYLDNARSRKEAPNENFAREVMELFTLGEGHYGERDIKEAARAFTGWSIEPSTGEYRYRPFFHDAGEKTVLGHSGRFGGDEVLDILLARPEAAEFVVGKLWREMVSPAPDPAQVKRLAGVFRDARYELKPLLRAMLLSDAFWAPENRASLIKSPVDLVVGTLRTFDIRPLDMRPAVIASATLGQNLLSPPNVKGWPGGEAWITTSTLLARKQWLDRVFRGSDSTMAAAPTPVRAPADAVGENLRFMRALDNGMATYAFDAPRWEASLASTTQPARLVLAMAPVNPPTDADSMAARIRSLVLDPAYQLR